MPKPTECPNCGEPMVMSGDDGYYDSACGSLVRQCDDGTLDVPSESGACTRIAELKAEVARLQTAIEEARDADTN